MTITHKLSTRTFSKTAKKEVLEIVGPCRFKKVSQKIYKLLNANDEMIGYVEEAAWDEESATLKVKND